MRNTVHCLTESDPERPAILDSIPEMVKDVQRYVPGYRLKNEVVFDGRRDLRLPRDRRARRLPADLRRQPRHHDRGGDPRGEMLVRRGDRRTAEAEPPREPSRPKRHAPRHVPARRHARQGASAHARADGGDRDGARRGRRAADRGHARRRPRRRVGQLRLPPSHRRGIPARRGAEDEARTDLGAAHPGHRHDRRASRRGRRRSAGGSRGDALHRGGHRRAAHRPRPRARPGHRRLPDDEPHGAGGDDRRAGEAPGILRRQLRLRAPTPPATCSRTTSARASAC